MTEEPRTGDPGLALDNQLCFALYAASRAIVQLYQPLLNALGLTYPQYLVMLALWEREPITVKELGLALHLDSGTLSPLVKRLEAAGLAARQRRPEDERSVEVALTDAGRALRARARTVPRRIAAATGLSLDQLVTLREDLVELTDVLTDQKVKPDDITGLDRLANQEDDTSVVSR